MRAALFIIGKYTSRASDGRGAVEGFMDTGCRVAE
jgi:hypothetical protein